MNEAVDAYLWEISIMYQSSAFFPISSTSIFSTDFAFSVDKILSVVANHLLKRPLVKLQSTMTAAQFETLKLTQPADHVLNVQLNRPKKLNAMNKQFFK